MTAPNTLFEVEDELEKIEISAICDLAVTVRGSIAYEMAMFGKPVLLAGRSVSSDLGFTHVAHSVAEKRAVRQPGEGVEMREALEITCPSVGLRL